MPSVPASNGWPAPSAGSTSGAIASRAVPDKSFQRSRPWQGQWAVRSFDRKFGDDFLPGVPAEPGVYRFYGPADALLYVGKARNLRRRLDDIEQHDRSAEE